VVGKGEDGQNTSELETLVEARRSHSKQNPVGTTQGKNRTLPNNYNMKVDNGLE
jgi:hypothetical protein